LIEVRYTEGQLTKRLIEIEDDLLQQARDALGTETIKDTVAIALRHAIHSSKRRTRLDDTTLQRFAAASEDLADDDVMAAAWR
jgi:Arc/MetJ family transcription regulator